MTKLTTSRDGDDNRQADRIRGKAWQLVESLSTDIRIRFKRRAVLVWDATNIRTSLPSTHSRGRTIYEPFRSIQPLLEQTAETESHSRFKRDAAAHLLQFADLRRTCAENLVAAGVPTDIIQRVMRHSDFNTTRKHYASGNARRETRILRELLDVPRYTEADEVATV